MKVIRQVRITLHLADAVGRCMLMCVVAWVLVLLLLPMRPLLFVGSVQILAFQLAAQTGYAPRVPPAPVIRHRLPVDPAVRPAGLEPPSTSTNVSPHGDVSRE
ncbi:hypothetical protein ABT093_31350 [Kitasatospora sp. NPDC002551]|uniref:hypothetical protein n=1 Tax=Kitasatospora sp. NPDC002551 TaxID=3154539 RepID=UPI003317894C